LGGTADQLKYQIGGDVLEARVCGQDLDRATLADLRSQLIEPALQQDSA
jgi:hypothetical protein